MFRDADLDTKVESAGTLPTPQSHPESLPGRRQELARRKSAQMAALAALDAEEAAEEETMPTTGKSMLQLPAPPVPALAPPPRRGNLIGKTEAQIIRELSLHRRQQSNCTMPRPALPESSAIPPYLALSGRTEGEVIRHLSEQRRKATKGRMLPEFRVSVAKSASRVTKC